MLKDGNKGLATPAEVQKSQNDGDLSESAGKSAPLKAKEFPAPSPHLLDEMAAALRGLASFPCPLCGGRDCSPRPDPQCPMRAVREALDAADREMMSRAEAARRVLAMMEKPDSEPQEPTCASCRFGYPSRAAVVCRRHPPAPDMRYLGADIGDAAVGAWPLVDGDDWCGEYEEAGQ